MGLRENLAADRIAELEWSALVKVAPSASLREAIAQMREQRSGCAIISEGRGVVGILTERDVLKRLVASPTDFESPVSQTMTAEPVTIRAEDSVGRAVGLMLEGGYRHLPVVDEQGGALGVISVHGIVHYLVAHFPSLVYNLPPAPAQVQTSREGA